MISSSKGSVSVTYNHNSTIYGSYEEINPFKEQGQLKVLSYFGKLSSLVRGVLWIFWKIAFLILSLFSLTAS